MTKEQCIAEVENSTIKLITAKYTDWVAPLIAETMVRQNEVILAILKNPKCKILEDTNGK
jgi:hypothetical protein